MPGPQTVIIASRRALKSTVRPRSLRRAPYQGPAKQPVVTLLQSEERDTLLPTPPYVAAVPNAFGGTTAYMRRQTTPLPTITPKSKNQAAIGAVEQIAGSRVFVAAGRRSWPQVAPAAEPYAAQNTTDGGR